jgi:cell division protease FtsH
MKRLVVSMGGKAAESVFYGDNDVSLGAVQDLKQANSLAEKMIGNFGMGTQLEVFYNQDIDSGSNSVGRSFSTGGKYSEKTKELFDMEALNLVNLAYLEARELIYENKDKMMLIIDTLLQNTTITGSQFNNLF